MSTPTRNRASLNGPVGIHWDIENCPIPSDVWLEDVAGNIRKALCVHPIIDGAVTMFSAYGDFNAFPRGLREGCQRTGVEVRDYPNMRKGALDKIILTDMFFFAIDNPTPSSIVLITGDIDFLTYVDILCQRGHTTVLVIPSGVGVLSTLSNAGSFIWDWNSVVRGEGFVPPVKRFIPFCAGHEEFVSPDRLLQGTQMNDDVDGQNEEESIACDFKLSFVQ